MCHYWTGDTTTALKYLGEALKRDKGRSPAIYLTIAQVYFGKKDSAKWNENIVFAKQKFPLSDLPHLQHANFLISKKDTANWIVQLKAAVEKKTQNRQVYEQLRDYFYRKGDIESAQKYMQILEIIERNSNRK